MDSKDINQSITYCVRLFTQNWISITLPLHSVHSQSEGGREAFSLISTYVTRQTVFIKFGTGTLLICFIRNTQTSKIHLNIGALTSKNCDPKKYFERQTLFRRGVLTQRKGSRNIKYVLMRVSGRTRNSNGQVH